jgi:class 3 adenylate cyclase
MTADLSVDPELLRPEVSNRVIGSFLGWFTAAQGEAFVGEVIDAVGVPRAHLADPEGWISYRATLMLAEGVARRLGLPAEGAGREHPVFQHWRQMGRRFFRPEDLGVFYGIVRAVGSPGLFYRAMPGRSATVNRCIQLRLLEEGPGFVSIEASSLDGSRWPDTPWACWNRVGILEAAPEIWGLPAAQVEHHHCAHATLDPQPTCVYHVRYRERRLSRWAAMGLRTVALGLVGLILAVSFALPWTLVVAGAALLHLALEGWWEARRLRNAYEEELARSNSLFGEVDRRYTLLWEQQRDLHEALLANRKFSAYLPAELVSQLQRDPRGGADLQGEETDAAVLFADIAGFTPRCERQHPRQVVADLNRWFQTVDPVIQAHDGIIDKRIGDAIMVVFVPRGPQAPSAERRAVDCGRAMLRALDGCNAALSEAGREPFRIRIGVAAGPLIQGTMGSAIRYEYTVIGDVVNLAARLEAKATPGHLLAPAALVDALGLDPALAQRRSTLSVRGKAAPIEVVELGP